MSSGGETEITLPAVDVAERSDPGRDPTKQINEDACGHRETRFGLLAVVCDGMGGHVGGREASTAALATIFEAFEQAPPGSVPREVLRDAIRLANVRVRGLGVPSEEAGVAGGGRPGSTVVAVLVHAAGTEVAHVGDSRVYLVQQGEVFQITRDHSMVQEMVDAKILTLSQAAVHPDANKITRALGIDDDVEVTVRQQPLAHVAGDTFVLCSDGLSDLVDAADIRRIVSGDPPAQAAGKLVDLANARGGHDNITVMLVRPRTSAPSALAGGGGVGPTMMLDNPTLRPPAAPPFTDKPGVAIIPAAPPPAPPSQRARRSSPAVTAGLVLAAVGLAAALAMFVIHARERGGKRSATPFDGGTIVTGPATPSSSVVLAPVAPPDDAVVDASDLQPLAPVDSASVRHPRAKPPDMRKSSP
jgi:serine/threonine protein phosphatase PrpC